MGVIRGESLPRRSTRPVAVVVEPCEPRTLLASALTFTVTNANNTGPGSIRQAITLANQNLNNPGEADTIKIDIAGADRTVELLSPLPSITDPVVLGLDANELEPTAPLIELYGGTPGVAGNGLTLTTSNSYITGVAITRFTGAGIVITGNANAIGGATHVGSDIAGTAALGNFGRGIAITGNNNVVTLGKIVHNGGDGIAVLSGTGNDLAHAASSGGSIHSNAGTAIDIGTDGITVNDTGDPDGGSNNSQNTPVLLGIGFSDNAVTVGGTINTTANTTVLLDFFANPTAAREGRSPLTLDVNGEPATPTVTTNASGNASFTFTLKGFPTDGVFGAVAPTSFITVAATAQNILNPGAPPEEQIAAFNTSEFSAPLGLPAWLEPTSAASWNNATKSLTVTGAATIVADPAADNPVITATGSAAVLSMAPATGQSVRVNALTLSNGARATLTAVANRTPTNHRVLVAKTLSIDATSTLDLADNDLVLDYDTTPPDVAPLVARGFSESANWSGTGIVSSAAAIDATVWGLGYADNASLPDRYGTAQGGPLFAGVDVDNTAMLIKYTWVGDLNIDGRVNFSDLVVFNGSFDDGVTSNHFWYEGDFDYNGVVDFSDLVLFNGAYDEDKAVL